MRPHLIAAAIAIAPVATPVSAEVFTLVCENPRREYSVTYDADANTVIAGDTTYKVEAVERTQKKFVVSGKTIKGGPNFKLHLRPYRKLDFYEGYYMAQTNGCY